MEDPGIRRHSATYVAVVTATLLAIHLLANCAEAQTIPSANIIGQCRANFGITAPANLCAIHEERARDYVNYMWMALTPASRQFCMQFVGEPFMRYRRVAECVWRMHISQMAQPPQPATR